MEKEPWEEPAEGSRGRARAGGVRVSVERPPQLGGCAGRPGASGGSGGGAAGLLTAWLVQRELRSRRTSDTCRATVTRRQCVTNPSVTVTGRRCSQLAAVL